MRIRDFLSGLYPFRELFPSRVLQQLVEAETRRIGLAERHQAALLRMTIWFKFRPTVVNASGLSDLLGEIRAVQRSLYSYGRSLARMSVRSGPGCQKALDEIERGIENAENDITRLMQEYDRLGEQCFSVRQWNLFLIRCHGDFLRYNASNAALDRTTRREIGDALLTDSADDEPAHLQTLQRLIEPVVDQLLIRPLYVEVVSELMNGVRIESRLLESRIVRTQHAVDSHTFYCVTALLNNSRTRTGSPCSYSGSMQQWNFPACRASSSD